MYTVSHFYLLPYSRKFSRDPIFADGRSAKISRSNFRGWTFTPAPPTIPWPLGFLFHGFNFRGSTVNRENRENWIPRKFPAIRYYMYNMYVCNFECVCYLMLEKRYTCTFSIFGRSVYNVPSHHTESQSPPYSELS